jgi:hypothetical protein
VQLLIIPLYPQTYKEANRVGHGELSEEKLKLFVAKIWKKPSTYNRYSNIAIQAARSGMGVCNVH